MCSGEAGALPTCAGPGKAPTTPRAGDTVQKLTLAVAFAEGDILVLNIHCLLAGTQILILSSLFVTW